MIKLDADGLAHHVSSIISQLSPASVEQYPFAALAPGSQMGRSFRRADQTIRSVGAAVASTLNGRRSTTPACLACMYHLKKSINSVGLSPASPSPFARDHALNSHTGHLF